MPVLNKTKWMSSPTKRRRLAILSQLERELSPAEIDELCSLRLSLRKELFAKIQLQKRGNGSPRVTRQGKIHRRQLP